MRLLYIFTLRPVRPFRYLVQATESNVQQIFLKKGSFEPELLGYAERIKQTTTVGEQLSGGVALARPATAFTGPVQFFLGEFDFPVCGGDCKDTYDVKNLTGRREKM
ncbi:hypothetical protein K469DRAFT_712204 [Zopfia rhizophila CBS 207.26]|uniref:Uncharacterized protein n=1 Tax=Zopfia rhizophila CBS 207.26 TaxID=1314779 RepID=A0A6A6ERU2_9PEZI|nr:hypothetical protein K469DRAFT_712204 [Zopfia rhizophila CBS 207.26]